MKAQLRNTVRFSAAAKTLLVLLCALCGNAIASKMAYTLQDRKSVV